MKNPQNLTVQYLIYISLARVDVQNIKMRYEYENIWLIRKMIAQLYGISVPIVHQYIKILTNDGEISNLVIKYYLITASDKKQYNIPLHKIDYLNLILISL